MSMDFGKLNFAVGFNRTSAFPLDANSYFESYTDAVAAAASAAVVGSSDSAYYIGQLIIVNESGKFGLYQIGADKTLVKFGQASNADDLKSQLDALKARVDGLDNSKADWLGGTAPVDKNGEIVTIGAAGSITASGFKIINSAVNNSTTEVPTSKAVQTYVASQVAGAVQYLGTVSALTGLSTIAGKGDFYRLSAAIEGAHAGDLVVAEKNNPQQLIDGENWSLIHGEEVGVEAINAGSGINVSGSEAQPTIAVKPATTTTIGGIIVGTNLTVDATGKLSAIDTTYEDATTTTHGLMSSTDKSKLDGIAEGANKTIVDSSLNATSTNPVENKAVHAEFNSVRSLVSNTESSLQGKIDQVSANLSSAQTTLQANIDGKVNKVEGKGLSTNDYTTEEKNKLAGLENYTLPVASEDALGGIRVGYSGTTEKTYAVKLDANNKAYVEVPWQNTTYTNGNGLTLTGTAFSLNVASSAMHGGIKLYNDKLNKEITPQAASEVNGRYYRIQLDNANRAFVNVPWTDTTYTLPTAKQDELGGIKLKYVPMTGTATINAETTTAGRFYAINVDKDGYAFVNVPWTDTKYTLPIATDKVLGGIKSGNKNNNFVARSGGEGQTENVPNYEAEVVVSPTTGKATVDLEAMAGPETQWSIVAGQTVFGIREISTDKLVQGTNTLIINGGGAAW